MRLWMPTRGGSDDLQRWMAGGFLWRRFLGVSLDCFGLVSWFLCSLATMNNDHFYISMFPLGFLGVVGVVLFDVLNLHFGLLLPLLGQAVQFGQVQFHGMGQLFPMKFLFFLVAWFCLGFSVV